MEHPAAIPFAKMNGLGNDFVVIDARLTPVPLDQNRIRDIADRQHGVGCDQLIRIEPSDRADAFMRIWNSDGGEVEACGNATRCIGWGLMEESGRDTATVDTSAGLLRCRRGAEPMSVTVDMGKPRLGWQDIPLAEPFADTRTIELQIGPIDAPKLHSPSVVNVGNPHCIFWVDDPEAHDLAQMGPLLENHPIFPERANISLAHVTARDGMTLKVWERGVGLTRACGTAACAAAVAGVRKDLVDRRLTVTLPGGDLAIEWRGDDHIEMTGPVEMEFDGVLGPETFAQTAVTS
ncbi:MAG: diaminopimelate epimerase [Hyphomicrobiales bacterium]